MQKETYANLGSVSTTLGGGVHGHIGMVMPNAEYITISTGGAPYIAPDAPLTPVYGGTAAQIANQQQAYSEERKEYTKYSDLSDQIKKMLLAAVPHQFLRPLNLPTLGFAGVNPRQIMDHLVNTYGTILESDLTTNLEQLQVPWNPDTPIESLVHRAEFRRVFAARGEDSITDATYIRCLIIVLTKSGIFKQAIDEWEKKPKADKTVANLETHFTEAYQHRLNKLQQGTKDVLAANKATTDTTKIPATDKDIIALVADAVAKATKDLTKTNQNPRKGRNNNPNEEITGLWYC
jgi:hypothetical protein